MDQHRFVHPFGFMPGLSLPEKWQKLQPVISKLYVDEGRKLDQVMEIVRLQYGFDASKHQYKYHIRHWKLKKSISKKARSKMYEIIEHRAARGKSTLLEYNGKTVDGRKLVRHAKDQSGRSLIRHRVLQGGANTARPGNEPALSIATPIFMKWNMPYGALRRLKASVMDHPSPLPIGPSPSNDIVATTPTFTGILSPSADSPSRVSRAEFNKRALERAYLFIGGKHNELTQSIGKQEAIVMSTWLYQFWMFAFRTARHWGKGPRNWTKELLDLDRHMETLSISAAPTPGMTAPSPAATTTPVSSWLTDGVTPSILCHWAVHVPYLHYEPIHSPDSDDLDDDSENPMRNGRDWPRSWARPSFVDRLRNGLRHNLFSNIRDEDLPVAIPRLLQNAESSADELLEESLGFAILGRNVFALHSVIRKMRRTEKKVENLYPFHLATSYLSGSDSCCNVLSFMVSRPSIFPLSELYINEKGHTVLDNLLMAILKSHTRCVPADVDENAKRDRRFDGEEVDICGRWDADSDELRDLLARGEPRIPFDWKHKFCHTSVQWSISEEMSTMWSRVKTPTTSCARHDDHSAGREGYSRRRPIWDGCLSTVSAPQGAKPSLTAELSLEALWGVTSPTVCVHESLDALQLAERVPASQIQHWNPAARMGWRLFCYVLKAARRLGEHEPQPQDVIMWDEPQAVDHYFHPFFSLAGPDTSMLPRPQPVADDDANSVDEEVVWCHWCGQPNYFNGSTELRDLWAAIQAEILTYRRLRDWHNWLSDNFNLEDVVLNLEAGNGVQTGFFQKGLLRDFCDCGAFEGAEQPDFACVDEVCREYFSNLEEWERTTYMWCPEVIDEDEEIVEMKYWDDDESDDEDEDEDDDDEYE